MEEHGARIQSQHLEDIFHRLFWDQQVETMAKLPTQWCWHPMLIRWCLHLRTMSTAAHGALRGVLTLPCGQTLQDYTRCVKADVGVQTKVTEHAADEGGKD